jgi:hypothetical protein
MVENQSGGLVVSAPGLLVKDQNPNGYAETIHLLNGPQHGALTGITANNGSFNYAPSTHFYGTDEFTYCLSVVDPTVGTLYSNVATVTINVLEVTLPPVANPDQNTLNENTTLTEVAPGVLANDADPNGNLLTAIPDTPPQHGIVSLALNGSFVYTPNANYFGTDSFTYFANNGSLNSLSPATVTLTVNEVPIPPTAGNNSFAMIENQTGGLVVAAPGLLVNDQNLNQ